MALDLLRMLTYFDQIAREKSIRRAADKLNIVSSALTRRLIDLEEELGTALFERHARGVTLTEAGKVYLRFARSTLSEHSAMLSQIEDFVNLRRGKIRISSISSVAGEELPDLIADFQSEYSQVTFEVSIDGSENVVNAVAEGEVDIGIALNPPKVKEFRTLITVKKILCAIMHKSHPLATKASVSMDDCRNYPLALTDSTWGVRKMLDEHLGFDDLGGSVVLETDSNEVQIGFSRRNGGIFFQICSPNAPYESSSTLVAVPIDDFKDTPTNLRLGVNGNRTLPVIVDVFCDFVSNRWR